MSSLTGNKKAFTFALLAAGFVVVSLAIATPVAFAQNATMPGGNQTGGNTTSTAFEGNPDQAPPPAPPAPGGNMTGGNQTGGNMTS
ncbi:hypothetical protein NTE_00924 [Candidatus Nitrososphaera evergladensis SR1]|jgi:hypothetical protein|uniref:Uncharacterized protein n=1 Tax=Candidatus Nitrososphaera evergladensis SR1 TaxID=1459636 RepID=A0A075MPD0_9ARCH|nr:hypothetical protein [Candidatus Nitrososphaera evergladensis]AIF83000.1 hypothetical protein NTE_00924 [Candidatus Nitrososphaera evergladensis SR1]